MISYLPMSSFGRDSSRRNSFVTSLSAAIHRYLLPDAGAQ
jgi:hypothetical protein